MLHLADRTIGLKQNLATGRASERLTGLGLVVSSAQLWAVPQGGARIPIAAQFQPRAAGYFAFSLMPSRDMPDLSAAPQVTLRAELTVSRRPLLVVEQMVTGALLSIDNETRQVAGREVEVSVIRGAPIDLSISVDPRPVALAGIVLRDGDPAQPEAAVQVSTAAGNTVTGADGRFVLTALPLVLMAELELSKDGTSVQRKIPVDYDRPVNTATLSWPD